MSTEELLKPRYKVIADYPSNPRKVGQMVYMVGFDKEENEFYNGGYVLEGFFSKYPHLFRKLEWWEDRDKKDLPKYVKCIKTPDQKHFPNQVFNIRWWDKTCGNSGIGIVVLSTNCYLPATEEEYLNQTK